MNIKQNRKFAKRLERLKKKQAKISETPNTSCRTETVDEQNMEQEVAQTPNTKTKEFMTKHGLDPKEHEAVRKELLFSNVLVQDLKEGLNENTRKRHKLGKQNILSARVVRHYKFSKKLGHALGISRKLVSRYRQEKYRTKARKSHLKDKVNEFLLREDNCTIMPGKKDTKKVQEKCEQKGVLTDYLHNLYFKFKLENPNIKISRATFCRFRPKQALTANFCSRSTCLCSRHQNTALKLKALKNCGAAVNVNPDSFIRQYDHDEKVAEIFETITKPEITFSEWKKVQDNGKYRCKQVQSVMPTQTFKQTFLNEIKSFRGHVSRVKNQYTEMRHLRENLDDGHVLVWMDFAENFSCNSVNEVQSCYWNAVMVTLHTQVVYFPKSFGKTHQSIVGVSECLSHNATSVYAMMKNLIPMIKEIYPNLQVVHYLTDSPTSQYRNKTIFYLVCHHLEKFGVRATWDYLEAGHGKGPCDGLGASVKRSADMSIKQGKAVIQSVQAFFAWTQSTSSTTVKYFYVSNKDVEVCSRDLDAVLTNVLAVPGTMKLHAVYPVDSENILTREMSCYCEDCKNVSNKACDGWLKHRVTKVEDGISSKDGDNNSEVSNSSESGINANNWVKVEIDEKDFAAAVYDNDWYIGQVLEIDSDDSEVLMNFMEKCGGKVDRTYRWPKNRDELWISDLSILKRIAEPLPCGKTQRTFRLNETEKECIETKFVEWKASN